MAERLQVSKIIQSMEKRKSVRKWLWYTVCVLSVLAGGIYYYGIVSAFTPNAEDLGRVQRWYMILYLGYPYHHANVIIDIVSLISTLIGGMSYHSLRLMFSLRYMIILGISLYVSIRRERDGKLQWYVLPLWAFFMILIHTANGESNFGATIGVLGLGYQFPYVYHNESVISALGSCACIQCYFNAKGRCSKKVALIVGIIFTVYSLMYTDLLYYVMFVIPAMIVFLLRGLYNERMRKLCGGVCAAGLGLLLLTRIFPGNLFDGLWGRQMFVGVYDGVYGGTSWFDVNAILSHITCYVRIVMQLFNIEIFNRQVLSFWSVLYVARIVFVIIGYVIVFKTAWCSIKGNAERNGYTVIDEILAWGFLLLSGAILFTGNGLRSDYIRYYSGMVPILTVLLCRNGINYLKKWFSGITAMRYKKYCFAAMLCVLCICQAEPVWRYHIEDPIKTDFEAVIDYIRQWNGKYAIAGSWMASRLSAMSGGISCFFRLSSR